MANFGPNRKIFLWNDHYGNGQHSNFDEFMVEVKNFIANIGPENLISVQEHRMNHFTEIYVWYWENVPVPTQSK